MEDMNEKSPGLPTARADDNCCRLEGLVREDLTAASRSVSEVRPLISSMDTTSYVMMVLGIRVRFELFNLRSSMTLNSLNMDGGTSFLTPLILVMSVNMAAAEVVVVVVDEDEEEGEEEEADWIFVITTDSTLTALNNEKTASWNAACPLDDLLFRVSQYISTYFNNCQCT